MFRVKSAMVLVLITLILPLHAQANMPPDAIQRHVPEAELVGKGTLTVLFWDAYHAKLYAPGGQWNPAEPYALMLHYLTDIEGKDIAERSVEEMRKQGFTDEVKLAAWFNHMQSIFPDVENGTELTGIYMPGEATIFYRGQEEIGRVPDPEFGKHFFDIWLSTNTSEPSLRTALLGL